MLKQTIEASRVLLTSFGIEVLHTGLVAHAATRLGQQSACRFQRHFRPVCAIRFFVALAHQLSIALLQLIFGECRHVIFPLLLRYAVNTHESHIATTAAAARHRGFFRLGIHDRLQGFLLALTADVFEVCRWAGHGSVSFTSALLRELSVPAPCSA
ncbi:hypothetical protein [Stutzerimonas stutzeri]|uniref:hypothetical protein n=1 Tax=Stutzerimonas stutzeri TaxID=316 RepID=UPI0015E3B5DA|nr:hypothetical protein [Stutzerimonas stutzeri]MBA1280264.1 hypothetical protein [Stutzerimonas stutzeri]